VDRNRRRRHCAEPAGASPFRIGLQRMVRCLLASGDSCRTRSAQRPGRGAHPGRCIERAAGADAGWFPVGLSEWRSPSGVRAGGCDLFCGSPSENQLHQPASKLREDRAKDQNPGTPIGPETGHLYGYHRASGRLLRAGGHAAGARNDGRARLCRRVAC